MEETDISSEATYGNLNRNDVSSSSIPEVNLCNNIGDCLIFNHETYHKGMELEPRKGSCEDATELVEVFSKLNFCFPATGTNDKYYKDLPGQAILKVIKAAALSNARSPRNYFVCCILTHGGKSDQLATYNGWLTLDDVLAECLEVIGKKKVIFFIQACRANDAALEKLVKESTEFGGRSTCCSAIDMLVARSTYPDTLSTRTPCGTYFIQEVCHAFKHLSGNLNLFDVLRVVNYRMANFFKGCIIDEQKNIIYGGQMPIFTSTLTSEINFSKTNDPVPSEKSLLGQRMMERGYPEPPDVNAILELQYDVFDPDKVSCFFQIRIQHKSLTELESAAAFLSMTLKEPYSDKNLYKVSKRSEVWNILKESAQKTAEKAECVFCMIVGPSSYGSLCDAKGKKIRGREVVECFVKNQASQLVKKPKIFLFLTCESVESMDSGESSDKPDSLDVAQHADILEINIKVKSKDKLDLPVQVLKKQVKGSSNAQDFLSILTRVNCALHEKKFTEENDFHFSSTLTKKFILPKPKEEI